MHAPERQTMAHTPRRTAPAVRNFSPWLLFLP